MPNSEVTLTKGATNATSVNLQHNTTPTMKENQDSQWDSPLTHRVRRSNWSRVFTAGCRTTPITRRVRCALYPVSSVFPAERPERMGPEAGSESSTLSSFPNDSPD